MSEALERRQVRLTQIKKRWSSKALCLPTFTVPCSVIFTGCDRHSGLNSKAAW